MRLEERIYNGEKARNILDNEVFIGVFDDLEQELIKQWKSSANVGDREKMHLSIQLLEMLKNQIIKTLESGKLAKAELNHMQSLREKLTKKPEEWLRSVQY